METLEGMENNLGARGVECGSVCGLCSTPGISAPWLPPLKNLITLSPAKAPVTALHHTHTHRDTHKLHLLDVLTFIHVPLSFSVYRRVSLPFYVFYPCAASAFSELSLLLLFFESQYSCAPTVNVPQPSRDQLLDNIQTH